MIDIPDFIYKQFAKEGETSAEPPKVKPLKFKAHVRIEKSGRSGKVVTLVEGLPREEAFLKSLAKKIKAKAGSGGTFYLTEEFGVVEIQGDKRDLIQQMLKDL
jgi:translation initiation factor 1